MDYAYCPGGLRASVATRLGLGATATPAAAADVAADSAAVGADDAAPLPGAEDQSAARRRPRFRPPAPAGKGTNARRATFAEGSARGLAGAAEAALALQSGSSASGDGGGGGAGGDDMDEAGGRGALLGRASVRETPRAGRTFGSTYRSARRSILLRLLPYVRVVQAAT